MENDWTIHAALRSGMGRIRHNNEDAFYFNGCYPSLESMDSEANETVRAAMAGSMFAVCDGIGGENNGEIASFTAVSQMANLQKALSNRDFEAVVQHWVRDADRAVRERSGNGGCTLALLYFQEDAVRFAHIGDSRVYRCHGDALTRMTQDHSKVQMLLSAGLITPEEAKLHPQRHVITRYIGMTSEGVTREAAVGRAVPAVNGDRYIVCSDGITDMLADAELQRLASEAPSPEECAEEIYRAAMAAGGRDNATVIVAEIAGAGQRHMPATSADDETTVDETSPPERRQTIDMNIRHSFAPDQAASGGDVSIHIRLSQQ